MLLLQHLKLLYHKTLNITMKQFFLIILMIFTMSSKNDTTYVVCVCDMPNLVISALGAKGEPIMSSQDEMAMKFPDSQTAQNFIATLDATVDFFGPRPTRPK